MTSKGYCDSTYLSKPRRVAHGVVNIDLEGQYRVVNSLDPLIATDLATKNYIGQVVSGSAPPAIMPVRTHVITVWAEENSSLENNTVEWSWGNGATHSNYGYVMMSTGRIIRASASFNPTNTSATIQIIVNNNLNTAAGTFNKILNQATSVTVFATPIALNQGDFINFRTQTETGTTNQALVCLLIEIDL